MVTPNITNTFVVTVAFCLVCWIMLAGLAVYGVATLFSGGFPTAKYDTVFVKFRDGGEIIGEFQCETTRTNNIALDTDCNKLHSFGLSKGE